MLEEDLEEQVTLEHNFEKCQILKGAVEEQQ